jgi:hypothetical protein
MIYFILPHRPLVIIKLIFGWLLAAMAISMSAPFWFDLLGKVVNVRNAGSKPAFLRGSFSCQIKRFNAS